MDSGLCADGAGPSPHSLGVDGSRGIPLPCQAAAAVPPPGWPRVLPSGGPGYSGVMAGAAKGGWMLETHLRAMDSKVTLWHVGEAGRREGRAGGRKLAATLEKELASGPKHFSDHIFSKDACLDKPCSPNRV